MTLRQTISRVAGSQLKQFLAYDLRRYLKTPVRKSLGTQISELSRIIRRYRCIPWHYFQLEQYRANYRRPPEDLIPPYRITRFQGRINQGSDDLVQDKISFEQMLAARQVETVHTLYLLTSDSLARLDNAEQRVTYEDFLGDLIERKIRQVFIKPARGWLGLACFSLAVGREGLMDGDRVLDEAELRSLIFGGHEFDRFLIQPHLTQHEDLQRINPGCTNTLRVNTYLTRDVGPAIVSAMFRCGVGDSPVDNVSRGGLAVGIDCSTGTLVGWGQARKSADYRDLSRHPDTGVRFDGLQIPYWSEAEQLVRRASKIFPSLPFMGWDLVVAPRGPLVLEANHKATTDNMQLLVDFYGTPLGDQILA